MLLLPVTDNGSWLLFPCAVLLANPASPVTYPQRFLGGLLPLTYQNLTT